MGRALGRSLPLANGAGESTLAVELPQHLAQGALPSAQSLAAAAAGDGAELTN